MIKFDDVFHFRSTENGGMKFPLIDNAIKECFIIATVTILLLLLLWLWLSSISVLRLQSKWLNLKRFYWHPRSSKYLRLVKSDCILHNFFFFCAILFSFTISITIPFQSLLLDSFLSFRFPLYKQMVDEV